MPRYIPQFSESINVTLANGNYTSYIDILDNPAAVIEILKNIDNVTIDRTYCTTYDLISSIIISWSRTLNNNLPEYQEITDLMHHILDTPDLYQHFKDKAVLPTSIDLVSDSNNLYSSNLLDNKLVERISNFNIDLNVVETLAADILQENETNAINNELNLSLTPNYIPPFSDNVQVKLANGHYYSFFNIKSDPNTLIEILKNIDNVTIDKTYCTTDDLISSIIISWSRALNNNLPEFREIISLMHDILDAPDLYEHLKDKAVLPITINLVSDPENLYSSSLLHDRFGKRIPASNISVKILESLDSNLIPEYEKISIYYHRDFARTYGNIQFQNSFAKYSFAGFSNNIKFDDNPNFMLYLLENISKVDITSIHSTNDKILQDFINILLGYNEKFKSSNIAEYTQFKDLLRNIAQDPVQKNYLKNLGATEHDLALLTANKQLIQEFAHNNTENSPQLFNNWRCMDLAIDIYQDNNVICNEIKLLEFLVGMNLYIPENPDYILPLTLIPIDENLSYVNPNLNNHNTAILISNSGKLSWNNNTLCNNFKYIKEVFDQTYFYGNSIRDLSIDNITNYVKHIFTKDTLINKPKTIHVEIHLHGTEDGDNIIELVNSLPEKPQNVEVTYIIKACHSRYGIKDLTEQDIIKKGNFIVSADYDENSKTSSDFDPAKFCKSIEENPHSLEGYLNYFSQGFTGSKIFFSGKLQDGTILQNVSIHEANTINHDLMTSYDLQIINHDTPINDDPPVVTAAMKDHGVWCKFKKWLCVGTNNVDTNSDIEENIVTNQDNPISEDDNVYTTTYENGNVIDNPYTNNQDIPLHGITHYTVNNHITG